jgi:hypothetical protein
MKKKDSYGDKNGGGNEIRSREPNIMMHKIGVCFLFFVFCFFQFVKKKSDNSQNSLVHANVIKTTA